MALVTRLQSSSSSAPVRRRVALMRPMFLGLLAEALAHDGQTAAALSALDDARQTSERTGERYYLPEIYRQTGLLLMGDGAGELAAESAIDEALDTAVRLARDHASRSYLLRAATTRPCSRMTSPTRSRRSSSGPNVRC